MCEGLSSAVSALPLNGVDLLVESAASEGMGGGKEDESRALKVLPRCLDKYGN